MLRYRILHLVIAGLFAISLAFYLPGTFDDLAWRLTRRPGPVLLFAAGNVVALGSLIIGILMNVRLVRMSLPGISFPGTRPAMLMFLGAAGFLYTLNHLHEVVLFAENNHLSHVYLAIIVPSWASVDRDAVSIAISVQELIPFTLFVCSATTLAGVYLLGWFTVRVVPVRIPRWQLAGSTLLGLVVLLIAVPVWLRAIGRTRTFLEMGRLGEMDSFENYAALGSDFFTALLLSVYAFLVLRDVYKLRRRGELTDHVGADTRY